MSEIVSNFVVVMYDLDKVTESDIDVIRGKGHLTEEEAVGIKGKKADNPNKGPGNNSGNNGGK